MNAQIADIAQTIWPILKIFLIIIIVFLFSTTVLGFIRNRLLKKTGYNKHQISNIKLFTRAINYIIFCILLIIGLFSYTGSWSSFGLFVGLLSAGLGFALQKPITAVAAWVMIVVKRPFEIGDRILIGDIKGDVRDITISHLYLDEIGGTVNSEERSGRTLIVPNHFLFDNSVTNYTLDHDYVLDEVVTSVTYESDLDAAMKLILKATKLYVRKSSKALNVEPYVRTFFADSCVNVHVRYMAPALERQKTQSNITQSIFKSFRKHKNVEIAYPHTEIIFKDKKLFKEKRPVGKTRRNSRGKR
ncbi:mechanosensitive ion channel [Candidatus Woesearchaeota archaeon]|nr:mechanosensitive ion channel [Candidatus Woesearchaeota archaeon]